VPILDTAQRHGFGVARLLGLQVLIPPGAGMSVVNVECSKVEGSASG
jgi:hypothetical protein